MFKRNRSPLTKAAKTELQRGLAAEDRGERAAAIEHYEKATQEAPDWSVPWFNLGLMYKLEKRWADSLRCNQRAAELNPEDQAAWWNLGIAATALGHEDEARRAWRAFGMSVSEDGRIRGFPHSTPVRIDPDHSSEVVWCRRIDPARAIIMNVPMPESGRRFGDLVLHDGQPDGVRSYRGREYSVFNELGLLERSALRTFRVALQAPGEEDVEALKQLAEEAGLAAEDWTSSVRKLCQQCSRGTPHEHHQYEHPQHEPTEWNPERSSGLAAHDEAEARALLTRWAEAGTGRAFTLESLN
jgi:tetratricopeptide (TPR) repeat protein